MDTFICRDYQLPLGNVTYIMGILNVTPDSFYDGGQYSEIDTAVKRAKEMVKEGADLIDIGGQSTRPGHEEISVEEELKRILPVIEVLSKELSVPLSVDTYRNRVAEKALEAGAHIINDIWGLKREPKIAETVTSYKAGLILMHNKEDNDYEEIIKDITQHLKSCIQVALNAGLTMNHLMIDPGIGAPYGKDVEQQYELLARLKDLRELNVPILHAVSRKSFLGAVTGRNTKDRLAATIACTALGIQNGVDFVRVHDIKEIRDAVKVADKLVRRTM